MYGKYFIIIINVLANGRGALFQKDMIKILADNINERQVRRDLKRLEKLNYIKIVKVDNKSNILYLTALGYRNMLGINRRISSTCNKNILETNFMEAYLKYRYENLFKNNMWSQLYDKAINSIRNEKKLQIIDVFKSNIAIQEIYIYENSELIEENYVTILDIIIYKHKIETKDLKDVIITMNEIIERYISLEFNILINYNIYSFNNISVRLLDISLEKHYTKRHNCSSIKELYKIECIDLNSNDIS